MTGSKRPGQWGGPLHHVSGIFARWPGENGGEILPLAGALNRDLTDLCTVERIALAVTGLGEAIHEFVREFFPWFAPLPAEGRKRTNPRAEVYR